MGHVSDRFSDPFSRFSNHFWHRSKHFFWGQLGDENWPQTFFLKLFGRPRDIPPKSRDIPPKKFGFPGFRGTYRAFWPPPLHVEDPHPTRRYLDQKVWVWVPFSCLSSFVLQTCRPHSFLLSVGPFLRRLAPEKSSGATDDLCRTLSSRSSGVSGGCLRWVRNRAGENRPGDIRSNHFVYTCVGTRVSTLASTRVGASVWDYNREKANFCGRSRVHLREHPREHLWEPFRGSIGGS